MKRFILALFLMTASVGVMFAQFVEYPIGEPQRINGMEVAAVYLKPVDMEPRGSGLPASLSDIHLEADVRAVEGNPNGFAIGEWIPYLKISFELINLDTGERQTGVFMPMVAADGPHYGNNIRMMGPGTYRLVYRIENPSSQGFLRHTDADTGVGRWFEPFTLSWEFTYVPIE
ncbi:iron transporter [Spirochaeta thermophila]|uniref:Ferrous iron transport protein n=1 Tax=Winmispira thermophila (strain ATCC 49972 / DSM 6192 / RI 19.B1) TaxID=665571 RepID=E0RPH0_WINT6|nr:hypothetical protein STHERM_c18170 [Spirochaeta thermophila DSM 6192]